MLRFVLDGAISSPLEWIFYGGLWLPLLIAIGLVAGLIALFIKLNKKRDHKE